MKLSTIKKNPDNPRIIRDEKFARLKKSIQDFPQMMTLRPIVVDESGMVLGGNMRLEALKSLGHKEIPQEWIKQASELSEKQKKEFIVKDNSGFGEWDWELLANEWSDYPLNDWGVDLPEDWLTPTIEEDEAAVAEMIDRAAELQEKWKVERGQVWQIGRHRLMCGDATNKRDVQRVCANNKPLLMVTDPPYGIEHDTTWREVAGISSAGPQSARNIDWDGEADWTSSYVLSPANVAYVWHATDFNRVTAEGLETADFIVKQQIIWNKTVAAFGRSHYSYKHDPCWYAVRKGKTAKWTGPTNEVTVWDIASPRHIMGGSDEAKQPHSTQKPLECMARPIRNHEGDVYDPFVGSGTTIVAAEQNRRTCYAMEIAPEYCAVTLERLSALGLTPKLA